MRIVGRTCESCGNVFLTRAESGVSRCRDCDPEATTQTGLGI